MTRAQWIAAGVTVTGAALLVKFAPAGAALPDAAGVSASGAFDDMGPELIGVAPGVRQLADAIAHAEGFYVSGSIPNRAKNPGDLVLGNKGSGTLGAQGITVFDTPSQGWAALYHQLQLITDGRSHVYTLDMSFRDMGGLWTTTQADDWSRNVVLALNGAGLGPLTPDDAISEVLAL